MKRLFLFALFAAVVSIGQERGFGQQPPKQLGRTEVDALLATPGKVRILDVRNPGETAAKGAFPVFVGVQADETDRKTLGLEKLASQIPNDREIIVVSGHADRAGVAAAYLARRGFEVAGALDANRYEMEGGQLVKFKPYTHWSMTSSTPPPGYSARTRPKAYKELNTAELDELLATPDRVLIIDVRSPGEIAYWGGFPVYLSIQAAESDANSEGVTKYLSEIPKGRTLVTVSGRANRSAFAASVLASKGFTVAGAVGAMTRGEEGGQLVKYPPYQQ